MSDLKTQLIRLGYTNPELREHLTPVLNKITSNPRFAAEDQITQEDIEDMRKQGGPFLQKQADLLRRDDGDIFKAVEQAIRGDVVITAEIDGVSGGYDGWDEESQTMDDGIGGAIHAYLTVDSESEPKERVLKTKLEKVWQTLAKREVKAVAGVEPSPEVGHLGIKRNRDGSYRIELFMGIWWTPGKWA